MAPADNPERWIVDQRTANQPLDRSLRALLSGASWGQVRRLIETGKVRVDSAVVTDATSLVRTGQVVEIVRSAPKPRAGGVQVGMIVHVDSQLVVVNKPAGISTVAYDENERDSLDREVADLLARREKARRPPLGIVHRLDKETTGLLVFARTLNALRALKNEFRFHRVKRRYWAVAHGSVSTRTLSSRLVPDRGDGLRGSTENPKLGRSATTHVTARKSLDGATLLECKLETGRTHQIRIHLAESGHPLVGERVYVRNYRGPVIAAPRVMLHAFELGFAHPVTAEPLHFQCAMPADMEQLVTRLTSPVPGRGRSM